VRLLASRVPGLARHRAFLPASAVAGMLVGAMDLRVMAAITTAITVERLAPSDARVVRAIGDVVVVVGLVLLARAVSLA